MATWTKGILAAVVGTLLIVLAIVALANRFLVPNPGFQDWARRTVTRELGPGVVFSSLSLALWPGPGLTLGEVEVGSAATSDRLSVEALTIVVATWPLLRGEVVLDHIGIEGAVLAVRRDADGSWPGVAGIVHLLVARGGEDAGGSQPRGALPNVSLARGRIEFVDQKQPGEPRGVSIENLEARLSRSILPGRPHRLETSFDVGDGHVALDAALSPSGEGSPLADTTFEAKVVGTSLDSDQTLGYLLFGLPGRNPGGTYDVQATLEGHYPEEVDGHVQLDHPSGTVELGVFELATPVHATGVVEIRGKRFAMRNLEVEARAVSVPPYTASQPTVSAEWADGALRVSRVDAELYGGKWHGQGTATFGADPTLTGTTHAEDVDFRRLVGAARGAEPRDGFDTLSAELDFRTRRNGEGDWLAEATGTGRVRFTGGSVASSGVLAATIRALPGLSQLWERAPGERAPKRTKLENLDASFDVRDARAFTEDLTMATSDFHLEGRGSVGFDGSVALVTEVAMSGSVVADLYSLAVHPFDGDRASKLPAFPMTVTGTLGDPHFRPELTEASLTPLRALVGVGGKLRSGASGIVGFAKGVVEGQ